MERIQPERSARRRLGMILLVMTACTGGGVSSTPTTANSSPVAATTGTSSTTPVLETAVELPGEFEPIAPGTYSADTDGDEATATRGTFSIEDDGWLSLGGGVMKDTPAGVDGGLYVSLLVVEIDQVWEDPCNGESPVPAGSSAEGLGG